MAATKLILCGGAPVRGPNKDVLALALHGSQANVNLEITNITQKLAADLPDVVADLLEIATYVYSADQAITRGGEGVSSFGRNWRRKLVFRIPVRKPDVWGSPPVIDHLRDTLSFLSEHEYDFQFERQTTSAPIQQYLKFNETTSTQELDEILLFSGGLDSLGGAVREAVCNRRNVALVSHRSNSKIHSKQRQLVQDLGPRCLHRPLHIQVWANKDKALGKEHTQRTRSFLFASLAFAAACIHRLKRIKFYENGVISLNLPISEQVVGARATRTTHPQVLNGFAAMFSALISGPFAVENPFLWLTKGEVVDEIGDSGCADLIKHSSSCTHTLEQTKLHTHCGRCSQCISRRFGTLASKYGDQDPQEMYKVDLLEGKREEGVDLTLIESFIRMAADMKAANEVQLVEQFGEVGRVLRHVPFLTADKVAENIVRLHRRHAEEVTGVMERALASRSAEILEGKLPATCAIILSVHGKYPAAALSAKTNDVSCCPSKKRIVRFQTEEADRGLPYSKRDERVLDVIGKQNFQALTNEEISKRFGLKLKAQWGIAKRGKPISADALRACLNRIRRQHQFPRSEDIRKKAVKQ